MEKKINLPMTQAQFAQLLKWSTSHQGCEELQLLSRLLETKLESMIAHDLYSEYKTARSDAEKAAARERYLKQKGLI